MNSNSLLRNLKGAMSSAPKGTFLTATNPAPNSALMSQKLKETSAIAISLGLSWASTLGPAASTASTLTI